MFPFHISYFQLHHVIGKSFFFLKLDNFAVVSNSYKGNAKGVTIGGIPTLPTVAPASSTSTANAQTQQGSIGTSPMAASTTATPTTTLSTTTDSTLTTTMLQSTVTLRRLFPSKSKYHPLSDKGE